MTHAPDPSTARARLRLALGPVLVGLVPYLALTLPHFGQGGYRTDTGRYAAVGLQMWRTGELWTPMLAPGELYFNKPPLAFWIHGLVQHALGTGLWAARLPSVLAGALCVVVLVRTVRLFARPGAAAAAGLVLGTTIEFTRRTKEISLDLWQALFLLAAMWAVAGAVQRGRPGARFAAAGAFVGLALMTKPLVGLVALPILAAWLALIGRWRWIAWLGLSLVVAVAVAAPWHVSMALLHGDAFTKQYFGSEIADRAAGAISTEPWWYFAKQLGERYWPWLPAAVLAVVAFARRRPIAGQRRGVLLALLWSGAWLVLLSIFPDKRPRYTLLVWPALAWLAGCWLSAHAPREWRRWLWRNTRPVLAVVAVGAVVFALLPVRVSRPERAGFAMLAGWMAEHPGVPLVAFDVDTNDNGTIYMRTGRWIDRVGGSRYPDAASVPAGALWVHTRFEGFVLPEGHELVWEGGGARLTRPTPAAEAP